MCILNERVIENKWMCLINSEEITPYGETLLTLFVGDKGPSRCGAIQISGSRVQWVFQRRSGAVLFAILYRELQDYCAQGAVKSLPTPWATETTGVRLSYHQEHTLASVHPE